MQLVEVDLANYKDPLDHTWYDIIQELGRISYGIP